MHTTHVFLNYGLIYLLSQFIFSCQSQKYQHYRFIEKRVTQLKQQQKYKEAIDILCELKENFPKQDYIISKELAFLYGETGQYQKSLEIWENGHQKGYFYGIFPHFPMYQPFKKFDKFQSILETDNHLRKRAIENSKTIFELILPENYNPDQSYPLFIILHSGSSSIQHAKKYWQLARLRKEFIQVYIQSYLLIDMTTYGWRIKDDRARKDIKECYSQITKLHQVDIDNVMIAGISAGGYTAMDIAVHQILPINGFIAVCPQTEACDYDIKLLKLSVKTGLRGAFICGEQDQFLSEQKNVYELFIRNGLPARFELIANSGHGYPNNFESRINTAIDHIRNTSPVSRTRILKTE